MGVNSLIATDGEREEDEEAVIYVLVVHEWNILINHAVSAQWGVLKDWISLWMRIIGGIRERYSHRDCHE